MIYPVHWNGVRYCRIAYTVGDVGVPNAGTPVSDMPTTAKPRDCAMKTGSETFAQIMERRQHEMHEREQQATAWAAAVTEQLANERSSFIEEFTAEDRRIFGVEKCKA